MTKRDSHLSRKGEGRDEYLDGITKRWQETKEREMSATPNLDELRQATANLQALLLHPEPGMSGWHTLVGKCIQAIAAFTPSETRRIPNVDDLTVQELQGLQARINLLLQHKVLGDPSKGFTSGKPLPIDWYSDPRADE